MTSQILKKQNTWRTKGPLQYHKIPNINHELRQERMKLIAGFILSWLRIFPYYFKALFEEGGGGGGGGGGGLRLPGVGPITYRNFTVHSKRLMTSSSAFCSLPRINKTTTFLNTL